MLIKLVYLTLFGLLHVQPSSEESSTLLSALLGFLKREILTSRASVETKVEIQLESVISVTSERYLSIGFSPFRATDQTGHLVFSSPKVYTLASAMAPCYMRLGGTESEVLMFNPDADDTTSNKEWTSNHTRNNFTMSGGDWDRINSFARSVGWRLVFSFNVLLRDENGHWNDSDARSLLNYTIQKGYNENLDFQMGNEPDAFPVTFNRHLSATQLGRDFKHLHRLLRQKEYKQYFEHSKIIGPDVTNPSASRPNSIKYLTRFLLAAHHKLDVVSIHQYSFNGATAYVARFLNAAIMDHLANQIQVMKDVMGITGYQNTPMWLSETSAAYGGGAPGLSDRYVAGFLWLDKLGTAAREGFDVVVREAFAGGFYSLIDKQFNNPRPDYWLSLLYKRLVGTKVLSVTTNDKSRKFRVYAHCTSSKRDEFPAGSITVYALNVHPHTQTAKLEPASLQAGEKLQYLLTPYGEDGLTSSTVALNGEPLRLIDDHTLPQLTPVTVPPHQPLTLPANTFGFWVFPAADAKACV